MSSSVTVEENSRNKEIPLLNEIVDFYTKYAGYAPEEEEWQLPEPEPEYGGVVINRRKRTHEKNV